MQSTQVTQRKLCNQVAESGLNHREFHNLCFIIIPRHKNLEWTSSKFHISSLSIINDPWRWEIICKYHDSKETRGGLPDEHGILSTKLLGINVIVAVYLWNFWGHLRATKDSELHNTILLFSWLFLWTGTRQNSKARVVLYEERKRDPHL